MNIPKIGIKSATNGIHKVLATGLLVTALTIGSPEQANAQAPQNQTNIKKGVESTKRNVNEIEKRAAPYLTKAQADALDASGIMKDDECIKIIDILIQRHEKGIGTNGLVLSALFLMADRKKPNKELRDFITKRKGCDCSEKFLDDIINSCRMSASLMYVKD